MLLNTIKENMAEFIQNNPQNFVEELDMIQIWDQPLMGVASASDPLWKKLKEPSVIGPDHLTPEEWLPGAKSVISYFLPFTEHIRSSNRQKGLPSVEWLYGRCEGEVVNNSLRKLIIELIESSDGKTVAPALDKRFTVANHVSNWSERHAAFIAGLGTFSLNYSLITNLGAAGRFGSVITDIEFEPSIRPYKKIDEYCTKCGECIPRCPPTAIDENGKDAESCSKFLDKTLKLNKPRYGCGKCQTAVPCEYQNPTLV